MSQQPVGGVKNVGKNKGADGSDSTEGALNRDDSGQWDFTGNGSTTATQVTQRMLDLESSNYSKDDIKLPSNLTGAQKQQLSRDLAGSLLAQNPNLSQNPDAAIGKGDKFSANVSDLKKALQPFLSNPNLATFLQNQITGSSGGTGATKKFGDVKSQGLSLPYEPG